MNGDRSGSVALTRGLASRTRATDSRARRLVAAARGPLRLGIAVGALLAAGLGCRTSAAQQAAAAGTSGPHGARTVLVELFTSQGCSSCPAADAFVRALPGLGYGRERVVPLTFHVDYWDELGWKDPFASPAFTARQRDYVRAGALVSPDGGRGLSGPYTPQMIVDGHVHFSGGRRQLALAEIDRAAATLVRATLSASAALQGHGAGTRVAVTARVMVPGAGHVPTGAGAAPGARQASRLGSPAPPEDWRLFVALARKSARTPVARGENGGNTLEEADIVRALSPPTPLASRTGGVTRVDVEVPADLEPAMMEVVAFVQSTRDLRVVAATALAPPARPRRPRGEVVLPGRQQMQVRRRARRNLPPHAAAADGGVALLRERDAGRHQLAGQLAVGRAVELVRSIQAIDQRAGVARGAARAPGSRGGAARAPGSRGGATRAPGSRRRWFGTAAAHVGGRGGRQHDQRQRDGAKSRHQYFTQISSLASSDVSAVTPVVAVMSSTVAGLALYAAVPFQTI